jgi:cytochrome c oxidase assembly protein subunit 15
MKSSDSSPTSDRLPGPAYRPGPHWIAVCAAVFTLPLLYVGGTVTTYHVGLAVPDWPTTFGMNMFLYDFWNAPFGVRVEHTHRLYGAAVGLATVLLCLWFLAFEPRRWLKGLGILALCAVIVQGILGGTRVTRVSTLLAVIHGVTGQAFFGLMVALCVFTSRKWYAERKGADDPGHLRVLTTAILSLVVLQIILGSWSRHFGTVVTIATHSLLAAVVWIAGVIALVTIERNRQPLSPLAASARMLATLTTLQILLGAVALVGLLPLDGTPRPTTFYQALVRTVHQTNGALILAACVVLCLRAHRHLGRRASGETVRPIEEAGSVRRPLAGGLDWEAVA